jgi:hypothetical protein
MYESQGGHSVREIDGPVVDLPIKKEILRVVVGNIGKEMGMVFVEGIYALVVERVVFPFRIEMTGIEDYSLSELEGILLCVREVIGISPLLSEVFDRRVFWEWVVWDSLEKK